MIENPEDFTPEKNRKQSGAEGLINCKKSRNDTRNNLGIPHVGELIFESTDTPGLVNFLDVSQTWKELDENVLNKR